MKNKFIDFKSLIWRKRCLMMAIANKVGLTFPVTLIIGNCIFFIVEIIWGRKYIGLGTIY